MRSVADILPTLREKPDLQRLPAPEYRDGGESRRLMLGVECMRQHMTDEGEQLQQGLADTGYERWGYGYENSETDVARILRQDGIQTVFLQDKREWDSSRSGCFERRAEFQRTELLAERRDIFKVTVVKDSHQDPAYHHQAHAEIGTHAWIVYYHPEIVHHHQPWLRRQDMVRTYHSINRDDVPELSGRDNRQPCLLSGAIVGKVYPLRNRIRAWVNRREVYGVVYKKHPGYHADGSCTPDFLKLLNSYRVSIATASCYGYSLRKIIESTACGCVVITDLPTDDVLPHIDGNLVRVNADIDASEFQQVLNDLIAGYDTERQRHYSQLALKHYDYRALGVKLANDIDWVRRNYSRR